MIRQQMTTPPRRQSNLAFATTTKNSTESPTKSPNNALTRRVVHPEGSPCSKESYSKPESHPSSQNSDFKDNNSASKTLSKNFQSLKLESMSTAQEYGAASNTSTLASALQKNIMHGKQFINNASGSLVDYNDSESESSSSGDERELTHTIFQEQVKFFCQMKDFLLSQQMALRHQLEALNFKLVKRRPHTRRRRMGPMAGTSSTLHIPNVSTLHETDVVHDSEPDVPPDNIPHFFSCSSTERSDIFQSCPICGIELDTQENTDALEEHVIEHFTAGTPH